MAGERTVLVGDDARPDGPAPELPPLRVEVRGAVLPVESRVFTTAFGIGREPHCELWIDDDRVSRQHVEIAPEGSGWWVRDLGSLNGTYVAGSAIASIPVGSEIEIELGAGGPRVILSPGPAPMLEPDDSTVIQHTSPLASGVHDPGVAQALKRTRHFAMTTGGLLVVSMVVIVGLVLALRDTRNDGIEFFYEMKGLELEVAKLREQVTTREEREALALKQQQLDTAAARYEAYVDKTAAYGANLSPEDRLILGIARVFGESELDVPEEFAAEVKRYIAKWQSSKRYRNALERVNSNGHRRMIIDTLKAEGLPPHFFYLAMQESNFNPRAVGPITRYGHAKGMWQFITPTAKRYGLTAGPLANTNRYDSRDDRFNVPKATAAAAKYLKRIYETDAQASGLLVMASYNWGEGNIIKRLRKLPEDPRERNFWTLLRDHKIPDETYDYVFHIFAAAVIGEDPGLFGFDFAPPLA